MQNAEVQKKNGGRAGGRKARLPGHALYVEDAGVESPRVLEDSEHPDLRERTTLYARRIIRLYVALPKTTLAEVLGKQVLRSGTSVGANYRECCRSRSKAEFIAKMGDCLREIDETAYWLELIAAENILPSQMLKSLQEETWQLTAIFVSSLKRSKTAS